MIECFGDTAFFSRAQSVFILWRTVNSIYLLAGGGLTLRRKKNYLLCGWATMVISCTMEELGFCVLCGFCSNVSQQADLLNPAVMELSTPYGVSISSRLTGTSCLLIGFPFSHGLHKYWKSILSVQSSSPARFSVLLVNTLSKVFWIEKRNFQVFVHCSKWGKHWATSLHMSTCTLHIHLCTYPPKNHYPTLVIEALSLRRFALCVFIA